MTGIASRNTVLVDEPRPGVVLVTLNRPERLNAMNHELVGDLHAVLDQVGADRSCRVVVLTGAGRGFCSGLDLKGAGVAPGSRGLGRAQAGWRASSTSPPWCRACGRSRNPSWPR